MVVVSDPVQKEVMVVVGTGTSTMMVPVSPGTVAGIVTLVVLSPVQVSVNVVDGLGFSTITVPV